VEEGFLYQTSNKLQFTHTRKRTIDMEFLKVSSKSAPASVAGAIAGMVKDHKSVEMQCVGAGAVNQAVKAIAIARGFLSPTGIEIAAMPSFADIEINGEKRTAIHISIVVISVTHADADAHDDDVQTAGSDGRGPDPADVSERRHAVDRAQYAPRTHVESGQRGRNEGAAGGRTRSSRMTV
jgi:stage V sporulation protein S